MGEYEPERVPPDRFLDVLQCTVSGKRGGADRTLFCNRTVKIRSGIYLQKSPDESGTGGISDVQDARTGQRKSVTCKRIVNEWGDSCKMILTVTLNAAIDKRYVVENFRLGEVNRVKECAYTPGGKGLNVSKPAAIAGEEVGFVGGHAGNYIEEALKPFGIQSEFYHLEAESRSCINIWDATNRVQTEFLEPGFTVTEEQFQGFLKKFRNLVKQADVIAMSGSVPKGLDGSAYQRLVEICREEKRNVILDTSGALLTMGIEAKPTMIKPNLDEIRMLTGMSCDSLEEMIEAAKQIHEGGVEIVAVSLGAEGSFVVCEEGIYQAQVPKIDAVNTVGCGDSMIAGFAVGMSQKISVEGSLRLASAISAAAALREETGFFVKEDMERIFKEVKITKLK